MISCRWRLVVSTCLLVWSFSSLFITHRLLRNEQKKGETQEEENPRERNCEENLSGRRRQIVEGWFDFHGELIKVPDIDEEGADGFSADPSEFAMKVGVGRHDSGFEFLIYDQVRLCCVGCLSVSPMLWMITNDCLLMIINCSGSGQVLVGRKYQQLSSQTGVTVATQTSVERLHWLVESSNTWQGPMSVVVFVPDKEFDVAQLYISYLRSCFTNIRDKVAWSLVHPVTRPPRASNIKMKADWLSCSDPGTSLARLVTAVYSKEYAQWRTGYDYPQNHLRNIARDNSLTHYTLSLDVDVILAPGSV